MTLKEAIELKEKRTTQASQNMRALALSGIGIVWVLSNQQVGGLKTDLLFPLISFGTALVLDFLHYAVASFIWGIFVQNLERKIQRQARRDPKSAAAFRENVHAKSWFNWPALFFFWSKQGVVLLAYAQLFHALFARLGGCPGAGGLGG